MVLTVDQTTPESPHGDAGPGPPKITCPARTVYAPAMEDKLKAFANAEDIDMSDITRRALQPKLVLGSGNDNLAKKLLVTCTIETKFVTLPSLDPGRIS